MCGITGIIMKDFSSVDSKRLKEMNDSIQHRGPDGEGFYYYGNVGFGHRRLSILDLSDLGAQPMKYGENLTITYNGEVYNYIEIRESLKQKGYVFTSGTDTEVILASYQEWGEECVHRFNGMWAFAIHDIKRNIVFISRDRFGVKPLHYFEDQQSFLFGSEIKQILTQVVDRKVNMQMLFDYLYLGYHHHTNFTFFENILSLAPGHNLIFNLNTGQYQISKWYTFDVKEQFKDLSFDEAQRLFESTIDTAIHLRLRSDVRVGTCLSGGMDSSYIATVAAKEYNATSGESFKAITAQSIEKATDESSFAKMVVNSAALDWKITRPETDDFLRSIESVIESQEEPFGSPSIIMQYFVMKKAKEEGCIVLLDGQGGDEALLGYDRYYAAYINQQKGIFNKIKTAIKITKNSKLSLKDVILYTLYFSNASIRVARQLKRNKFVKQQFKSFLNRSLIKTISDASKNLTDLQRFEITQGQLQKLLKYEDRNSMRFSIETRVPFVDFNVMELSISLPFDYKMNNGWSKYILRKTAESKLPKEIVWRQNKFGFEAPTKIWLAEKSRFFNEIRNSKFLDDFIEKKNVTSNIDDISLWKLYNITVWARIYKVQF